jgi:hypothetical protein
MVWLVLDSIDAEILQKLEHRAKRLGTTAQAVASRLLRDGLREETVGVAEPAAPSTPAQPIAVDALDSDPRFVRDHGLPVFLGELPPDAELDHRDR